MLRYDLVICIIHVSLDKSCNLKRIVLLLKIVGDHARRPKRLDIPCVEELVRDEAEEAPVGAMPPSGHEALMMEPEWILQLKHAVEDADLRRAQSLLDEVASDQPEVVSRLRGMLESLARNPVVEEAGPRNLGAGADLEGGSVPELTPF